MTEMRVKEETTSKLILEMDPSNRNKITERNSYLALSLPFIISGIFIFFIFLLIWALKVISTSTFIQLSALAIVIVVLPLVSFFVYKMLSSEQEVIISLDLTNQLAIRIKKFLFGRINQDVLGLVLIRRVLVHCEVGIGWGYYRLFLDAPEAEQFEVSSVSAPKGDTLVALSKKIGKLLYKPVILKVTEMGDVISEETIQT